MKKINSFLGKIISTSRSNYREVIFGFYLLVVFGTSVFWAMIGGIWSGLMVFTMLAVCSVWLLVPKIRNLVSNITCSSPDDVSSKMKIKVFFIAFSISFVILLICFVGSYPGSFSPDSINQYTQAISGEYSDWHPVWHTVLFFTFPLKLTGGWSGSIILFQMVYFSVLMGYMAMVIYTYAGLSYAIIGSVFIILSPTTLEILMFPWKDTAFAIVSGFCMIYAVQIYFSKGKWGDKFLHLFLFALMLVSATLFRHNGVLFTFFLVVALFFFMQRKKWVLLTVLTCTLFLCIKGPVYNQLDVSEPGGRIQETMGLPLSVITTVAKETPDRLNEETNSFVNRLLINQPDWKAVHNITGFNSIKFHGIDSNVIEEAGIKKILGMMFHCFLVAPKQSLKAVIGLTSPVYGLEQQSRFGSYIVENNVGLKYNGIESLLKLKNIYFSLIDKTPLRYLFLYIGMTMLIMLAFIIFRSRFNCFEDWKRIFLCLPIFFYNFGTMLLLTGHDVRFFYVSFIICPLVVLIMASSKVDK